eukprot:657753-Pleurochrysis_carterae.AAC.3
MSASLDTIVSTDSHVISAFAWVDRQVSVRNGALIVGRLALVAIAARARAGQPVRQPSTRSKAGRVETDAGTAGHRPRMGRCCGGEVAEALGDALQIAREQARARVCQADPAVDDRVAHR